ncbi:MAG: outer membrane beta-barrel protein [Bacteroidota bacterium]
MKKILLIALGCFLVYSANAQDKEDVKKGTFGKLTQADRLVFNIFSDIWMGAPTDSMSIKKINRGADFYVMKEFPFGKSNFSFALGLGVGCNNLYSNAMPVKSFSLDSLGAKVYDGKTVFTKIPSFSPDGRQPINFKNNKFTQVYLDIPLEFRYRMKNNAFKFYLGGKVGLMLSNHTKYNGDDYTENYPTGTMRIKEYKIANVSKYRYGITARIGWKWIQVYGYYSLSKLFKKDLGPDMYPISVGLTISPY